MCGRFALSLMPTELQLGFDLIELPQELGPRYNIAPTQQVLMITAAEPKRALWAKWGLVPRWAKDPKTGGKMINARAETIVEKPAYRDAFAKRRCLIPASGFFEWKTSGQDKTPMYIRLRSGEPFAFAGLWESWKPTFPSAGAPAEVEPFTSCTIITTASNALLAPIHDRMPVILPRAAYPRWLSTDPVDQKELLGLLRPFPADELELFAVSSAVNSVRNDSPECIVPAPEPPEQLELM
jgi:putative SOS response-associated peptidase YedK